MDVVATEKGFYKGQLRERGSVFTLKNEKEDFSERWMAKTGTATAKQLLKEATADGGGVTAAQIAMEEAEATGRAGAHKAEMLELREQIAALTAAVQQNAAPDEAPAKAPDATPDAAPAEAPAEEAGEEAAPTERKTRRTRR